MGIGSKKKFPLRAEDYDLFEDIGEGVSATVYRALCIPHNEIVAVKILDLEKYRNDLDGIRREVQAMFLLDHPNILQAYCSFTSGHSLWIVIPYMAGGSLQHILKFAHPDGIEEPVIVTILNEVLKALMYIHGRGLIHRDIKAGNVLIDYNGNVKLADFGVATSLYDAGDRQRLKNTFVGTPCWMAPEVMEQVHGYDFKADIWSFGITALELAHGHAPFSKYPPMKVLLMTLQNGPPGLDYVRDKMFSKSFREMVSLCLVKDPKKRPTSETLLKHRFFKQTQSNEYLVSILKGLPSLGERFRILKEKEADTLMQNEVLLKDKEKLSKQEYIRGISAWNFSLEDLKKEAALIPDDYGDPVLKGLPKEKIHVETASSERVTYSENNGPRSTSCTTASVEMALQNILLQNHKLREEILRLKTYVEQTAGFSFSFESRETRTDGITMYQQELESHLFYLQTRIDSTVEEIENLKAKNSEMEKNLNEMMLNQE